MSNLKLNQKIVEWAITHCHEFGDTDIFPQPFEYQWFSERKSEIAEIISKIDLNNYEPKAGLTYLSPKDLLGYRTADQLFPIDQIIFLSCLISMWKDIESNRADEDVSFSYRLKPKNDGTLFVPNRGYKDWIEHQLSFLEWEFQTNYVLSTDIADFYQRINHHRLENCLDAVTNNPLKKVVLKQLSTHRAKYSFGVPVGNNASRILAELILIDTDKALIAEGFTFTRYVDDYRFYLNSEREAYKILAFLAEHLYLVEGLNLSRQKTRIQTRQEYIDQHQGAGEADDQDIIRELTQSIYGAEDPDEDELRRLKSFNLTERLEEELSSHYPEANNIKILLAALKSLKEPTVVPVLLEKINQLLPFMREVVHLVEYMGIDDHELVEDLKPIFLDLLESNNSYLPITRVWILDLFAKGIFKLNSKEFKRIENCIRGDNVLETRQFLLCAYRSDQQTFFRRNKMRFDSFDEWKKNAFIYGARCLQGDEFSHWTKSIKARTDKTFGPSFLKWANDREAK